MNDATTEQARGRIRQLFRFLQAFNEKKNPIPTQIGEQPRLLWWHRLPSHPNIRMAPFTDEPLTTDPSGASTPDSQPTEAVLQVRRAEIPPPPILDVQLQGWVADGWDDPRSEPAHAEARLGDNEQSELFESSVERVALFAKWRLAWRSWADLVSAAYEVNLVFEALFDIRTDMEREAERYELVLGDGILNWYRPSGGIEFPVLLQRLQLDYDPAIPEFTLTESDRPAELNASLLRRAGVDGAVAAGLIEQAERSAAGPLGADRTTAFLRTLTTSVAPDGQYVADGAPEGEEDFPRVGRQPVMFLRSRAQGFEAAIANILEDIEGRDAFPDSLASIAGIHSVDPDAFATPTNWGQADEVSDVLLSKEANAEQLEIARRLAHYGAVRVKGPPGTGKTHTIANLVGHLLAMGQSVLVTSQTTKALTVLRDKIVDDLQPLCVSVLEGDATSRSQLTDSVTKIGARLASGSPDQLLREASALRQRRESLLEHIGAQRSRLLAAVSSEYAEMIVSGRVYTTQQAATLVADGVGHHDWIPGTVLGELPLSAGEIEALYATNLHVSREQERMLAGNLPSLGRLLSPEAFRATVDRLREIEESTLVSYRPDVWSAADRNMAELEALLGAARDAVAPLVDAPVWHFAAMAAGAAGGAERRPWDELVSLLQRVAVTAGEKRLADMQYGPRLAPGLPASEAAATIRELRGYIANGGSIGWLTRKRHGNWAKLLDASSCHGVPPWAVESLDALATLPAAALAWGTLLDRWSLQMSAYGVQPPGTSNQADEQECYRLSATMETALDIPATKIAPMAQLAAHLGIDWGAVAADTQSPSPSAGQWRQLVEAISQDLPPIVHAEALRIERAELRAALNDLAAILSAAPAAAMPDSPVADLLAATHSGDAVGYTAAYRRLADLVDRADALVTRRAYLLRLSANAPDWAEAIRLRLPGTEADRPPGDPRQAWDWSLIRAELDRRCAEPIDVLIAGIEATKGDLREVTAALIDRMAWAHQMRRTEPPARQALQLWLATIKRIGKGSGKNVPTLRRAAQTHMAAARAAVPVWIAPLSRVAESFDARTSRFDVVIIDEASQCDVMGLIALYLGAQVVVVGDDQQVTPAAVGDRIDTANQLIGTFLQGIPGKELYDGQYSIYEIAGTAFAGVTQLREHFRCVPDIIRFSNALSYDWQIVPLRDASSARVRPPVVDHRVENGSSDQKRNREEARQIASLILAAVEQPEYEGLSFGAISLLGAEQARDIEVLLRNNMPLADYQNHRVLCGTPPQFQGDERDVVFLSMVDGPQDGEPLRTRGDPGELWKKRYNVAASRARDQLWVVYSLDPGRDLKPDDIRWRLIEFARNPLALKSRIAQAQARAESPMEESVIQRLVSAGYRVTPQWEVGGYRIDLVVGEPHLKLAVECDGDRYHTAENLQQDLERQALLERLGWHFVRIRGGEYFRDPERALKPLFSRLAKLGITPHEPGSTFASPADPEAEALLARIRGRASEIRETWASQSSTGGWSPPRPRRWGPAPRAASPPSPSAQESSPPALPSVAMPAVPATYEAPASPSVALSPIRPFPGTEAKAVGGVDSELVQRLANAGFKVEDKRPRGGALWVYGEPPELEEVIRKLRAEGVRFEYSKKRDGWYLK